MDRLPKGTPLPVNRTREEGLTSAIVDLIPKLGTSVSDGMELLILFQCGCQCDYIRSSQSFKPLIAPYYFIEEYT